jgi:hypothetical protein
MPAPQGRPIIFQAGASDDGKKLAARHADAIFTHQESLVRILGVIPDDDADALEDMQLVRGALPCRQLAFDTAALVSIEDALNYLGRYFEHHDFSQYPLDEPFPDMVFEIAPKIVQRILDGNQRRGSLVLTFRILGVIPDRTP